MKRLSFRLLICLTLVILIAAPTLVSAQTLTKVYADSRKAIGTGDGTPTNPVGVGNPPNFERAIALLANRTGTIVYIFDGGWCELPVTNGGVGAPTKCSPGVPPETGLPVASSVWWGLGIAAVAVLLGAGLFLQRRHAA